LTLAFRLIRSWEDSRESIEYLQRCLKHLEEEGKES